MKSITEGRGEIAQVQGGHILRSTGRKDRHSKVYTSKGPRDRRVRLSANTAIQFYDVQDRLGYDRPSKAVDWLINKAKHAIDKLAELPTWNPNDTNMVSIVNAALGQQENSSSGYAFPSFIQQSVETQIIDDTVKSSLPTSTRTSLMSFGNYQHEIMSRTSVQNGELCLSLLNSSHATPSDQGLLSASPPLSFGENYSQMVGWNGGGTAADGRVGSIFNSQSMAQPPFLCQSSIISAREPLQSSYSQLLRQNVQAIHESSMSSSQFVSEFQVPARIRGEEEIKAVANKAIPASPNSGH